MDVCLVCRAVVFGDWGERRSGRYKSTKRLQLVYVGYDLLMREDEALGLKITRPIR